MRKFAIRLLTLAIYAAALVVVPTVTPAKAAADGSQEMKKPKKKIHKSLRIEAPKATNHRASNHKASNQAPYANPNDNPDRKVSY
jgi:hypothetical protein